MFLTISKKKLISKWFSVFGGGPQAQPPFYSCNTPENTGFNISNNFWIYYNIVPGHIELAQTVSSAIDSVYPNSGSGWTIGISSLKLVEPLYYIDQQDISLTYPFRQSPVTYFTTPAIELDPEFVPNQAPGSNSITNYNNAVAFLDAIFLAITGYNTTYFAGITPNPELFFGYNYVQNWTHTKMYDMATDMCNEQASTESLYENMVLNLFANYYVGLPCWPPIKSLS